MTFFVYIAVLFISIEQTKVCIYENISDVLHMIYLFHFHEVISFLFLKVYIMYLDLLENEIILCYTT